MCPPAGLGVKAPLASARLSVGKSSRCHHRPARFYAFRFYSSMRRRAPIRNRRSVCGGSRKSHGKCRGICGGSRKSHGKCRGVCGNSRKHSPKTLYPYLPMQNLEKMFPNTSSVTISPPVISPNACRQSRRSSANRSPGKPSLSPASTRRIASPARQSAS